MSFLIEATLFYAALCTHFSPSGVICMFGAPRLAGRLGTEAHGILAPPHDRSRLLAGHSRGHVLVGSFRLGRSTSKVSQHFAHTCNCLDSSYIGTSYFIAL